jgi:hypothetical protein
MSRVRRVAVTSPQTRLARARRRTHRRWRASRLDQAELDRALALYRAQRLPGLVSLALMALLLLGLPVVFAVWPGLDSVRLAGIPLSWLMLGALPFPLMVWLAAWQLRRAERIERRG